MTPRAAKTPPAGSVVARIVQEPAVAISLIGPSWTDPHKESVSMRDSSRRTLVAVVTTLLCCGTTVSAGAQSARSFVLMSAKGDSVGTIVVRDSGIFAKFTNAFGWMAPSMNCMAVADQPAVITTPSEMEKLIRHWLDSTKATRASTEAPPGVVTALTADTQTIGGIRTRRVRLTAPQ